jgi:hypothetical protein
MEAEMVPCSSGRQVLGGTCTVSAAGSRGRRNTSESFDPTALPREPAIVDANLDRAVSLFELSDFGP